MARKKIRKRKARKLQNILEDERIRQQIYYAKFKENFEQFKRGISGYILGYNEVLFYLIYNPETNCYEVNHVVNINAENSSTVYFARVIDIRDTENAIIQIIKYLYDVSCTAQLQLQLSVNAKDTHEEVNENVSEDDFDYGESAYISYIDDVINSLESQIKDTTDKPKKLLLESAVKNLKAWIILTE